MKFEILQYIEKDDRGETEERVKRVSDKLQPQLSCNCIIETNDEKEGNF
jgi:hypothetical protein